MLGYDVLPLKLASCDCRDLQSATGWHKPVFPLVKKLLWLFEGHQASMQAKPSCFSSGGLVSQIVSGRGSWESDHSLGLQKAVLHCGCFGQVTNHQLLVRELWPALLGLCCSTQLCTQQTAYVAQGWRNGKMCRSEKDLRKFPPSPSAPHHRSKLSRLSHFLAVGRILTSACLRPGPQGLGRGEWMEKLFTRTCFFWWHQLAVSEIIFTLAASKLCRGENWSKQHWSIKMVI